MKILTWNVNGLRAVHGKGFLGWLSSEKPEVACLQEIKAKPEQLPEELLKVPGYEAFFFPAERPGYSGTAIYSRRKPDEVWTGLGEEPHDREGRVLGARFGELHVISAYYPNSQDGGKRLDVKLSFCAAMLRKLKQIDAKGQQVVLCGDYNIAHTEIDLARPKENEESPGYLPEERRAMGEFLAKGYRDVFREHNPGKTGLYTWWSFRSAARTRNVGWRIDYTCVSPGLADRAKKTFIQPEVQGSDHCPVGLVLS